MGKIVAIWSKRAKRGVMDAVQSAVLSKKEGLVGDANRSYKRQITIIEQEKWEEMMAELDGDVPPATRRANIMVSGVDLANTRHRILQLGVCRVYIWGETRPCERMEEALPGLQEAMKSDWRGGAYGEVVDEGEIHVGDEAYFTERTVPPGPRAQ